MPVERRRRTNRFDRPPEPHDWRWVVGGIGRTLISLGLLMFGFVAYQLWGTGIATAQAQNRLEREFETLMEQAATSTTTTSTSSTTTTTTIAPTTTAGDPVDTTTPPPSPPPSPPPTPPPSTAIPPEVAGPPQDAEVGSAVAKLIIPDIGLDVIVTSGARTEDLRNGPGHFRETPMPGRLGNAAIAGHRTTHGAHFGRVDELTAGDRIVVVVPQYGEYTYAVTGTEIVGPDDYALAIPTTDPTRATLTLVSCHPKYTARQRIIVHAELVEAESPAPLPPPATLPAPDIEQPSVEPDDEPDSSDGEAEPAAPDATAPPVVADAFAEGWFSDPDAWPHVAAWGLALGALGIGAYLVSRRARRNWVGALCGIVPFLVVLYFFYENVMRLLPSAL
jgi:sortase A